MTHEQRLAVPITWKEGDTVKIEGKPGIVRYVYTNGYTLVIFNGTPITGGILSNNSTFPNEMIHYN